MIKQLPHKEVSVHYRIADDNHPMYDAETFDNYQAAADKIEKEYVNGTSKYWRNRPQHVEKVTIIVELVTEPEPLDISLLA